MTSHTLRELHQRMRTAAIGGQHCLTPDPGRKPKGLNIEQALIHFEAIYSDAVAALALLDEARAQEPWPDTRWVCIRDNRPDPVVLASRDPQDDEQGQA